MELGLSLGFCMGLGSGGGDDDDDQKKRRSGGGDGSTSSSSSSPHHHHHLHPHFLPQHQLPSHNLPFPWLTENCKHLISELSSSSKGGAVAVRGVDVNRAPSQVAAEEAAALSTSPNSTGGVSSLNQMDFPLMYNSRSSGRGRKREFEGIMSGSHENDHIETERRNSDEDQDDEEENGNNMPRKKLRLSKQQSAFLEHSFKEHTTLNPKQKLALAKHLNLRPRQVEVWFQNRRARTKLKQTEVDCEYLKRCCETLTEENRRLQKELQELRALKTTSTHPFYMHLPATTLTMCPSCERVASTSAATTVATAAAAADDTTLSLAKPSS